MEKIQNFIGGQWVNADSYLPKLNPATDEVIYELPNSSASDVDKAVDSAQQAFKSWSKTPAQDRANILYKIADGIEKRIDEFAKAETMDVGKPLWLSKEVDIPRAIANFRFFAGKILHHEEMSTTMDARAINYTLRQPLGVAGLITPWNLPIYLLSWKIAPALAVGNTVVCKPAELTSKTAYLLTQVMNEAGLPKGVCNMVFGKGSIAGNRLVEHPKTPLISFTGGTSTGAIIQKSVASMFKKVSLELGGKNPVIICDDADLDKAFPHILRSSFLNQGQICLGCERIFVHENLYDQFIEMFKAKTEEIIIGDPMMDSTYLGPMVSKDHMEKVQACIEQMSKDQGRVITGNQPLQLTGANKNGYFVRPTIVTDLPGTSTMNQTEIFGPVVSVTQFMDVEDAIESANNTPYGLSASIYTQGINQAHSLAAQINSATVWINTWLMRDLRVPFGGMKHSGVGREGGDHSIDFYTEQKTVCVSLS
jgi:acyl-CoA reductase-like NAD-dependent aldehyde dehydrogenase